MKNKKSIIIDEKTPLLFLAGPMFLELLLNTMLNNVDMLMLSHYDEIAVGAVLGLGVAGIYAGTAADECIRGLIVMYYWYKKKWVGKSVVGEKSEEALSND